MRLLLCLAGVVLAGCYPETVRTPIGPSLPVEPTLNAASAGYDDSCACDRQAAAPPLLRSSVTIEHPPGLQLAPPRPDPPVEVRVEPRATTQRTPAPVPIGGAYFPFFPVAPPVITGPQHVGGDRGVTEPRLPPVLPLPPLPPSHAAPQAPPPPPVWVIKAGSSSHGAPARPSAPAPQGSAAR